MSILQKELVSCKAHQHITLYRLEKLRNILRTQVNHTKKNWPGYTWYFDGKNITVACFGQEVDVGVSTKQYCIPIFKTVRQRDAMFAVRLYREVFGSPCAVRDNWRPGGCAHKLYSRGKSCLKKSTYQTPSNNTTKDGTYLSERTGKPYNVSLTDWLLLLHTFGFTGTTTTSGNAWRPALPISCCSLWLKFEEWLDDVEQYTNITPKDYEDTIEYLGEWAQQDDMSELATRMASLIKDIKVKLFHQDKN